MVPAHVKQQRHAFRWQSSAPVNHGIRGSDRDSGIHTLVIQKICNIAGPVYLSCSMLKRRQSFHESYRFFITCYLGFLALGLGFEPQRNKLFILKSQKQVWDPSLFFLYFLWSSSWLPLIFHYCFLFIYASSPWALDSIPNGCARQTYALTQARSARTFFFHYAKVLIFPWGRDDGLHRAHAFLVSLALAGSERVACWVDASDVRAGPSALRAHLFLSL